MKDHIKRQLINDLRDIAKQYHKHQCLRELIANKINNALKQGSINYENVIK